MGLIPLEEDFNWWWYKAKHQLLKHILKNSNNNLKILEIGPGLGNNLLFLNTLGRVDILESEKEFLNHILLKNNELVNKSYENLKQLHDLYDLIIMLDVLEHIKDSQKFMTEISNYLNDSGILILGVPAYNFLWSNHDEQLNHFRRYNWKLISSDCKSFTIKKKYGFNYFLLPLRYIQTKIQQTTTLKQSSPVLNNLLFLITQFENLLRKLGINPKIGISLYAVLTKKKG